MLTEGLKGNLELILRDFTLQISDGQVNYISSALDKGDFYHRKKEFLHTILICDEMKNDPSDLYEQYGWNKEFKGYDYVQCTRYFATPKNVANSGKVTVEENVVKCQLASRHRSSQEILDLADYLHKHAHITQ